VVTHTPTTLSLRDSSMAIHTRSYRQTTALLFVLMLWSLAALSSCAYESSAFSELTCEDGDTAPGKECRDGLWITTDGGGNNTSPGLDDGMPPVGDMDPPLDLAPPLDMGPEQDMDPPPVDMDPPEDMNPPVDMDMGCEPESDPEFCARVAPNAQCGVVPQGEDNCGVTRSMVQCAPARECAEGFTCSPDLACIECTPEDAATLCMDRFECGAQEIASTSCNGQLIQVDCGACGGMDVCGVDGQCCTPLSDEKLCGDMNFTCGAATVDNGCGQMVEVDCGGCGQGEQCANNQCECPPPTCGADQCGMITSSCGTPSDCGGCGANETCTQNQCVCVPEDDNQLCMNNGNPACGFIDVTDSCGQQRVIECNTCTGDRVCSANTCQNSVTISSPAGGNGIGTDEGFGWAVAIDGDTIVVGAPFVGSGMLNNSGSAFVYERDAITREWSIAAVLVSPDRESSDFFGRGVDIDESIGRIVIGEPGDNKVQVYERGSNGFWLHESTITPTLESSHVSGFFGLSVAVDGDRVVVGDPTEFDGSSDTGRVYVFDRSGQSWSQATVQNQTSDSGAYLGYSVSLDGDFFAAGAPGVFTGDGSDGRVYVYERQGSGDWDIRGSEINGFSNDYSGYSVSLDGSDLAVGWPDADPGGNDEGRARMYSFSNGSWNETQALELNSSQYEGNDAFGRAIALEGDRLIVARPGVEAGFSGNLSTASRSGIEYYSRSGNTWSRGSGFNPSNNDELYTGFDVDVSGELFVVGAPTRNGNARRDRFFIIRRQ